MAQPAQPVDSNESAKKRVNVPIPADLHRAFRMAAFSQGLSVQDAVIEAITEWTDTHTG